MELRGLNFLNMQSNSNLSFGNQNSMGVGSLGGVEEGSIGVGTNPASNPIQSELGLVGRLDKMDAGIIKPEYKSDTLAQNLDLYG